jgi:hypothetical protein
VVEDQDGCRGPNVLPIPVLLLALPGPQTGKAIAAAHTAENMMPPRVAPLRYGLGLDLESDWDEFVGR